MSTLPCITVRQFPALTLESRHNASGTTSALPPHWHDEYQVILTEYLLGEYHYRRARHLTPIDSLLLIHPGEIHSAQGLHDLRPAAPLRTMFIHPRLFQSLAQNADIRLPQMPFFSTDTLQDSHLFHRFRRLYETLEGAASTLEQDVSAQSALTHLMQHHARESVAFPTTGREKGGLKRVLDYLHEHSAENVALETLAAHAGLSPFHLCRAFRREFGLPPHRYQTQLRVERAKVLLRQGMPAAQVAVEAGFSDQAHLTRQFKQQVGVTPGRYLILQ